MTNEELVNNIVCKNCRVSISATKQCTPFNKEYCFNYSSALQVTREKDKQLQKMSENELKQLIELEDYCSYEVSNLLSKKGFNYKLNPFYRKDGNKKLQITLGFYGNYNKFNIPAPTHQMALKWLREIHKIYVFVSINICELDNTPRYYINIISKTNKNNLRSVFTDYYKAVDNAIKFVLEHLIIKL